MSMSKADVLQAAEEKFKRLCVCEAEMKAVLGFIEPVRDQKGTQFNGTYSGFTMHLFAFIDSFARHWFPAEESQNRRLVRFMEYLGYGEEESTIAVQLWRHRLVHGVDSDVITSRSTKATYKWLFAVPDSTTGQHMHFQDGSCSPRILTFDLVRFMSDLKQGVSRAMTELQALPDHDSRIQNWEAIRKESGLFPPRKK